MNQPVIKSFFLSVLALVVSACSADDSSSQPASPSTNTKLYTFKFQDHPSGVNTYAPRMVQINPNTGAESDLALYNSHFSIYGLVHIPGTTLIAALDGSQLLSLNSLNGVRQEIGQANAYSDFEQLIINDDQQFYGIKSVDDPTSNSYTVQLLQLNLGTGEEAQPIVSFTDLHLYSFRYHATTDEILALEGTAQGNRLYRINYSTGSYTVVDLPSTSSTIGYEDLIVTPQGNVYAYKSQDTPSTYAAIGLVQLNPMTGAEISSVAVPAHLNLYGFVFNAQTNEMYAIDTQANGNNLYKINVNNGAVNSVPLDHSNPYVGYENLVIIP